MKMQQRYSIMRNSDRIPPPSLTPCILKLAPDFAYLENTSCSKKQKVIPKFASYTGRWTRGDSQAQFSYRSEDKVDRANQSLQTHQSPPLEYNVIGGYAKGPHWLSVFFKIFKIQHHISWHLDHYVKSATAILWKRPDWHIVMCSLSTAKPWQTEYYFWILPEQIAPALLGTVMQILFLVSKTCTKAIDFFPSLRTSWKRWTGWSLPSAFSRR